MAATFLCGLPLNQEMSVEPLNVLTYTYWRKVIHSFFLNPVDTVIMRSSILKECTFFFHLSFQTASVLMLHFLRKKNKKKPCTECKIFYQRNFLQSFCKARLYIILLGTCVRTWHIFWNLWVVFFYTCYRATSLYVLCSLHAMTVF